MLTRPRDREVVCHASAWDMDDERRRAHQDVHEAHRGGSVHDLPRARARLLLHLVQGPARAVPGRRARWLPRGHRRHGESVGDARLSAPDRAGQRREALAGSRHQPADEDGARQDRLPAVRQAHRPVALGGVHGRDQAGRVQQGLVGTAREVPGRVAAGARAAKRISIRARSTTSRATRRTRATSCRSSCSSSSTRRCARRPGSRARCTSARSSATRRRARNTPRC